MAWSWVRVATGTSPKVRDCVGDDKSAGRFEECVRSIVANRGEVVEVRFEPNGRWARVLFSWTSPQDKLAILFDLEAEEVQDLLDGGEMDGLRR